MLRLPCWLQRLLLLSLLPLQLLLLLLLLLPQGRGQCWTSKGKHTRKGHTKLMGKGRGCVKENGVIEATALPAG